MRLTPTGIVVSSVDLLLRQFCIISITIYFASLLLIIDIHVSYLPTGTYPFPKACSSLVVYKDNLVLFGGWSHPTPFPLHQVQRTIPQVVW